MLNSIPSIAWNTGSNFLDYIKNSSSELLNSTDPLVSMGSNTLNFVKNHSYEVIKNISPLPLVSPILNFAKNYSYEVVASPNLSTRLIPLHVLMSSLVIVFLTQRQRADTRAIEKNVNKK